MKIILKPFLLVAGLLTAGLLMSLKYDNKSFEGIITYTIEFPNLPDEYKAMMANSELIMYIRENKTRSDMNTAFMNQSTITDAGQKLIYQLFEDMTGVKYYIKTKMDEEKKDNDPKVKINYKDETKTIAGYTCKKAEIVSEEEGREQVLTVFYTEEISNKFSGKRYSGFDELKGAALEFELGSEAQKMKMTAKSVNKEKVPDSKFDIPSEYKEITQEELKERQMKMMRGG